MVEIDDEVYGFTDEDILTLFQVAMQNSAEHQKTNRIHWVIISLEGKIKSKDALWPYRSKIAIQELRRLSQAPRNYISNNFIQQVEEMFKKGENSTDPNIIFPMPVRLLKYSALRKSPTIGAETFLKEITFDSHDLLTVGLPRVAEIRFRKRDYFGALVEAAATGFSVDISFCGATIFFIIKTGLLCRDFAYCSMDNVSQKSELRGAVE